MHYALPVSTPGVDKRVKVLLVIAKLIGLSFHDLIGESRGGNLRSGFPIKTFGNNDKADIIYA